MCNILLFMATRFKELLDEIIRAIPRIFLWLFLIAFGFFLGAHGESVTCKYQIKRHNLKCDTKLEKMRYSCQQFINERDKDWNASLDAYKDACLFDADTRGAKDAFMKLEKDIWGGYAS